MGSFGEGRLFRMGTTEAAVSLKLLLRVFSTFVVVVLLIIAVRLLMVPSVASMASRSSATVPMAWVPPDWFPRGTELDLLEFLEQDGPTGGPRLRSPSAIVFDMDAAQVIYQKNPDYIQPVASLTKLVAGLALVSVHPDLEAHFCVGPEHYPTRSGAPSRLWTDDCMAGWDALGAALVASDNRAAYAMASIAGMDVDPFIRRMAQVSRELNLLDSTWTDPSGLEDDDLSTARDMAKATLAVAAHPLLSTVASSPYWDVLYDNKAPRRLFSTNKLIARRDLLFMAAKTGYTDTARYCFTAAVQTNQGRRVVLTILGAPGNRTRWADVRRLLDWVEDLS